MFRWFLAISSVIVAALRYGLAVLHFDEVGAIKVKTAAEAAAKWGSVTPQRQSFYEAGAAAAGPDWEAKTLAAAKAFLAGITSGNIERMFTGGVKQAGAAKYTRKVAAVGVNRFSQGVQAAVGDYQTGVDPMLQTIAGLTLSARGPRGSAGNLTRVSEVATALNRKRLALRAAGG